ncbi:MAG: LCP family protein [Candidatus Peribacteria bacterium]|nr:MAG: LCP family protein [Candidatus Peribacteria bacterium]
MEALKDKITEITGEEIDFYVDVDFTGFIKTVDAVGGVTVSLENTFVDYEFPDEETGEYTTFVLRKGTWTLDGDVALKYARSRHSTSDFDRSQRQQEILASLKQRLIDNGYLSNPLKIKELFGILNDYVRTDLGLVDIIKLASQLQGTEQQIRSFHLNDTCFYGSETCSVGGILYVPERQLFNNLSVLLIEGTDINNLSNYTLSQRFADRIFNKTSIFEKNHTINIFNATKTKFLARSMADSLKKRGFNIPEKDSL